MKIKEKVNRIIAETFKLDYKDICDDSGPENISEWDSFGQMNLVTAVEEEFSIVFEFEEIFQIFNSETLINLVKNKLNNG